MGISKSGLAVEFAVRAAANAFVGGMVGGVALAIARQAADLSGWSVVAGAAAGVALSLLYTAVRFGQALGEMRRLGPMGAKIGHDFLERCRSGRCRKLARRVLKVLPAELPPSEADPHARPGDVVPGPVSASYGLVGGQARYALWMRRATGEAEPVGAVSYGEADMARFAVLRLHNGDVRIVRYAGPWNRVFVRGDHVATYCRVATDVRDDLPADRGAVLRPDGSVIALRHSPSQSRRMAEPFLERLEFPDGRSAEFLVDGFGSSLSRAIKGMFGRQIRFADPPGEGVPVIFPPAAAAILADLPDLERLILLAVACLRISEEAVSECRGSAVGGGG